MMWTSSRPSILLLATLAFFITTLPHQDFACSAAAAVQEETYADALDELEVELEAEAEELIRDEKINGRDSRKKKPPRRELTPDEQSEYRKKVNRRREQRERGSVADLDMVNDQLKHFEGKSEEDLRERFHKRQAEKLVRLDEMHKEVSNKLNDHHEGRKLMSDEEMQQHIKRKAALEKKRRQMEDQDSDMYIERMQRHEKKLTEKLERKKARHEERFQRREEEL